MVSLLSRLLRPFGFTPWPVTVLSTSLYIVLLASLLYVHEVVPPAPTKAVPVNGINVTEAWADLQELTDGFRPYNSRRNDEVRDWLLRRIDAILEDNGVQPLVEGGYPEQDNVSVSAIWSGKNSKPSPTSRNDTVSSPVIIYNDLLSNVTFSSGGGLSSSGRKRTAGQSVYFEGTNIIVYIRGSRDDEHRSKAITSEPASRAGGVLVSAHYDSVSTGFGATDNGVGVVTALQLIKYYTTTGHEPNKGIVILLNNGEEDFLNGARAFARHPISQFPHVFLNLEGAGAGGRATLFRSTDTEVTRFYSASPYPFGTVVSSDGFKRGLIRSQTDYIVFDRVLGLRGLDVAFMEPRARYHTDQDDTRHTSVNSLWHMLSASLATTKGMTSDTSSTFDWCVDHHQKGDGELSPGSEGVWFDLYGRFFAVLPLKLLYALSIALLVLAPLLLIILVPVLSRFDRMYFFSAKARSNASDDDGVPLYGWRGIARFPLALFASIAAVVGLAYLITKVNPFIIYSSPYAVWGTMLSAWIFVFWFCLGVADFVRPTALYRAYALMWMFLLGWMGLIAVTVLEERYQIAGGYLLAVYFLGIFLALIISFLECFALPRKSDYASSGRLGAAPLRLSSGRSSALMAPSADEQAALESGEGEEEAEATTESTSLLRRSARRPTTFAHYSTPTRDPEHGHDEGEDGTGMIGEAWKKAHGDEQQWTSGLTGPGWLLQLLVLAPINVILIGQVALLFTSATSQTGADGNSQLFVYGAMAALSTLLLLPLSPFLHRVPYPLPTLLLLVFGSTLLYNLVAFPFSANNRYKMYFLQTVDLETGINTVSLSGLAPFVPRIIHHLPSAAGQPIAASRETRGKVGLTRFAWHGLAPNVVVDHPPARPPPPPETRYADWLHVNVTRIAGPAASSSSSASHEAHFQLYGRQTRACKLVFDRPIADFSVAGAAVDDRFDRVPARVGASEIRLWRREWERAWDVRVRWEAAREGEGGGTGESEGGGEGEIGDGLDGKVVCLWSDQNVRGVIPALDEIRRYAPDWVAVTKLADGLVEGEKRFMV